MQAGPMTSNTTYPRSHRWLDPANRVLQISVIAFFLGVIWLSVYRDFVFGASTLLYKDIGSDSVNVYYPYLVHISGYLRSEGFPSWSFHVGMGQSISYFVGYLIWQPIVWLPKTMVSYALVFQHLFKILVAGLLFFCFLQLRGLKLVAAFLGSCLLAFSAYMCMGSCWYIQADEVVSFTALLFAAELAVTRGRWIFLVISVAVTGLLTAFHLYFCALFLVGYVPLRLFHQSGWQPWPILRASLSLAIAAVLGVGLGAVLTMPGFYDLLNSPRGAGSASAVTALRAFPIFGLESSLHYFTASLRPFANDILGTGSDFHGWRNYLEAPASYCGLICLLLLPQVFFRGTLRSHAIATLFLSAVLVPTVFPWFRYFFWLFQGDYYRTFSLFSILGIITLSVSIFSRYATGQRLNLPILAVTTIVLTGFLCFPFNETKALINGPLRCGAAILLIIYASTLTIGQLINRQNIVSWIVTALVAGELIYFGHRTVAERPTVTKQELKERVGYNDYTVDAIRDIKANDHSFFRLTKTWGSSLAVNPSLNDGMVFGYYGTSSYSSFNNLNYIKFLAAVDAISANAPEDETRWSFGLLGHSLLSTFACEKYVITDNPVPFQASESYEMVGRYENVYLLKNKEFLPLGLSYAHYVRENAFLQLPTPDKAMALLQAVVLSEQDAATASGLLLWDIGELREAIRSNSMAEIIGELRRGAFKTSSFKQTRITGSIQADKRSILVFQTPFDSGWRALADEKPIPVLKVDGGLLGVMLEAGEHSVELRFRPPLLLAGAAVTLSSLCMIAIGLWKCPRFRFPV